MSDEANAQPSPVPPVAEAIPAPEDTLATKEAAGVNGSKGESSTAQPAAEVATKTPASVETPDKNKTNSKQGAVDNIAEDKSLAIQKDANIDDSNEGDAPFVVATSADTPAGTPATASKAKGRRKSGGVPEHKGKKLNKKASKAKITHPDAKPGDYFFVRLKGHPLWPVIIADESMLPATLLKNRPVAAIRPDGTYREGYEDGGPKAKDRAFPVMYLHTNEFGWTPNYNLVDLDPQEVSGPQPSMRADLQAAYELAAEQHDLQYYKDLLKSFLEARAAEIAAIEAAEAAKAAKQAKKSEKSEKRKSTAVVKDEDVEMADEGAEVGSEANGGASDKPGKKSKKRKVADEDAETPQRASSVKKPRPTIKLNTPKTANGASTPKSAKDQSAAKASKPKAKKATAKGETAPEPAVPKKPELTVEERRANKQKEILFLRHKLQKGLLARDQEPKEEEMKQMSEFVTKLEGYADLEVSIIRATKINKVLKAMLKLNTIPREEEFQFKSRSQTLLDKWNKLLASEQGTPAATNGAGSGDKAETEANKASKGSPTEPTNGAKDEPDEPTVGGKDPTEETTGGSAAAKVNPSATEEPVKEDATV